MHSIADNYKFEFDNITSLTSLYDTDLVSIYNNNLTSIYDNSLTSIYDTNLSNIYDPWLDKVKNNSKQLSDNVFEFNDSSRLFIAKYRTRFQCTVCY